MPRIDPATAVANSQRKNSCPSSYGIGQPHLLRLPVGAVGDSPGAGIEPLAVLAGRLGDELLGPEPEAVLVRHADLVAPFLASRAPSESPSSSPGLPSSSRHASTISAARSSRRARSTPISAAGTIPNGDSAE